MNSKKISVIIPVYNTEKYLDKCIQSVLNQTYQELEIILINDGSTDNSKCICDVYAMKDSRIKVIHKKNAGLVAARKTGIEKATGNYLSFVDSDDFIEIDTYEKLVKEIDKIEPDIVLFELVEDYSDYSVRKHNHFKTGVYSRRKIEEEIFPQMLSYGDFFDFGVLPNLVCKLIKNSFIKSMDICVDDRVTVGEDVDLTFQMLIQADTIQLIEEAPYHYCKREDSMMWNTLESDIIKYLQADLLSAFHKSKYKELLQKQLVDYINFVSLLKRPKDILGNNYGLTEKKFALYGAGGFGQAIYEEYKENVAVWVDKNYKKYNSSKLPVNSVNELLEKQSIYDFVFIAILNVKVCREIEKYLIEKRISKSIYYFAK